jgi:hypothetical protein
VSLTVHVLALTRRECIFAAVTLTGKTLTAAALALSLAGCGASAASSPSASKPAASVEATPAATLGDVALYSGTSPHQIAATISAFYRATWQNQGTLACSLFSAGGSSGFMQGAKIAFPQSINSATTCPQAMRIFNATLADSVDQLQQAGVNISGNVLDNVGVKRIRVRGNTATAQAPVGVEEFIKPKLFLLVHVHNHWLIDGSRKIGKTLPQLLATARAHGKLRRQRR